MKYITIVLAFIMNTWSLCHADDKTFRVALRHIPDRLDVRRNQVNTNHYILIHLYYPLFHRKPGEPLNSNFLDMTQTKAVDTTFAGYVLCLKQGINFSDGTEITTIDLKESIRQTHEILEGLPKLSQINIVNKNCIKITLNEGDPTYFDKLMGVASTVIKNSTARAPFPIGYGPFYLKNVSPDRLELERLNKTSSNRVKKIEFIKFKSIEQARKDKIDDWNHIYQIDIPYDVTTSFKVVESPIIKAYSLVINLPSADDRRLFAACLNITAFKNVLGLKLKSIPGFLPLGILGYDETFTPPRASAAACKLTDRTIPFLTASHEQTVALRKFFHNKKGVFPFKVNVMQLKPEIFIEKAYSKTPYVAVIGFDSSGSKNSISGETSIFFESFIRERRLISDIPKGLPDNVAEAAASSNSTKKAKLYREAHRILLRSGYIYPLGQLISVQYYPENIENIVWGDRISGFPRIDEFLIKK